MLAVALLLFVAIRSRDPIEAGGERTAAPRSRIMAFGLSWAIAGWAPLFLPSLGWHAYYGLIGTLGMWLMIASLIARRTILASVVLAALLMVRAGRATTPSSDWSAEWFHHRAADFGALTQRYLMITHPRFPRYTRISLSSVPGNVGLVPGGEESPLLRVWYGDPTLQTRYLSRYQARNPADPPGPDYFFRWDSLAGWREIYTGPEDLSAIAPGD